MLETLQCQHGHSFERERVRGRKPKLCPEHAAQLVEQREQRSAIVDEPKSFVTDAALEILTSPNRIDPELHRKLSYVVAQLEPPRLARREDEDVKLMRETQDRLVREHQRAIHAS